MPNNSHVDEGGLRNNVVGAVTLDAGGLVFVDSDQLVAE